MVPAEVRMFSEDTTIAFNRFLMWIAQASSRKRSRRLVQSQEVAGSTLERTKAVPGLGTWFLVQLAGVYLLDWWFHFEPDDFSMRFWPRIIRGAFVLQIFVYMALHAREISKLRVAKWQFLWLGVLTIRFLYSGDYGGQMLLYMSAWVYWIFALWVGYCLVVDGHLTARQVAITGAIMNIVIALRNALWGFAGIWIGILGVGWDPGNVITNSAYPMLWFTLFLMLDKSAPFAKPMALLSIVAVVFALKRGAFVALVFAGLAYGITYGYIHRKGHGVRRATAIAGILLVVIGISIWANADMFALKWSAATDPSDPAYDAGSGREIFWLMIGQHWLAADLPTKFIGFGPHSVWELTGDEYLASIPAHNDWLNVLHEFGIIGVLAFGGVCWSLARCIPRLIRDCPGMAPAYVAALAGAFWVAAFDLFCYNPETAFFSLLMAVPLGMSERGRRAAVG